MIRPIKNKVFLQKVEEETVTGSGILLVDSARSSDGLEKARVIAVGPGLVVNGERVPVAVAPGDVVMIPRHSGWDVSFGGEDYFVVVDTDIAAVLPTA